MLRLEAVGGPLDGQVVDVPIGSKVLHYHDGVVSSARKDKDPVVSHLYILGWWSELEPVLWYHHTVAV